MLCTLIEHIKVFLGIFSAKSETDHVGHWVILCGLVLPCYGCCHLSCDVAHGSTL